MFAREGLLSSFSLLCVLLSPQAMGSQADEEWGLFVFCIHSQVHEKVFSLSPYSQLGEEKDNRADSGPVQVEAIFK